MTTLSNSWEKIMSGENPVKDYQGLVAKDLHKVPLYSGQKDVNLTNIENSFVKNDSDPGYQILSIHEIEESVIHCDASVGCLSNSEKEAMIKPKMYIVRDAIDTLLQFIDRADNHSFQAYHHYLRTLRELIIFEQSKCVK